MKPESARSFFFLVGSLLMSAGLHAAPCLPSATALCLSAQRFAVEVQWKDFQGNTGKGQAVGLTPDTGYFWFFTDNNIELVVKVLDARSFNNYFWVFFGALSNVEYTLTVTDTATGRTKSYFNPSGRFASVGDTAAFAGATVGVAATHETVEAEGTPTRPESLEAIRQFIHNAATVPFTPCFGASTDLWLANCRFKLEAFWQDSQGNTGDGHAVQLTSDTGYFWFFTDNNVELVVKVLDARAFNGNFWVFYGALSNVQYRITVTDTLSGDVKVYTNPQGTFASVGDTTAFQPGPSVSVVRDDARAVSDRFDETGGTLTATAADGTQFTLTLPQDALIFPVRITMTPVSRVGGPSVGGPLQAAVQIEPDGLFLWKSGDLKILPPVAPNLKSLTYFRYRGAGESFTPYPGVPAAVIEMPVSYLAGYGAAAGVPSSSALSLERVRRIEAGGALAPYVARAAALFKQMLDQEIDSQTYLNGVYAVWDEAWTNVVLPALLSLGSDCNPETIRSVLEMAFELLHLDPESDPNHSFHIENTYSIAKQQVLGCIELAYQRCKANNDPTEVMVILQLFKFVQSAALISDDEATDIWDKINKCLRFQIDFESALTIQVLGPAPLTERLKVRAIVPIRLDAGEHFFLSGSGEIKYEFVDYQGPPCTYSVATKPGIFEAERLDLGMFDSNFRALSREDVTVDMVYQPGDTEEQLTQTCPIIGSNTGPFSSVFGPVYRFLHKDERLGEGYLITNWQMIRSSDFFAKVQYVRSSIAGGASTSEETYIFLKHTPQ